MKIPTFSTPVARRPSRSSGYVLVVVMIMTALTLLILSSTLSRTATTSRLNDRSERYHGSLSAAEAATEKVLARMIADYRAGGDSQVAANLASYRTNIPSASDSTYWTNFIFSDAIGNSGRTYIQVLSNSTFTTLDSQYSGLKAYSTSYRLVANARKAEDASAGNAVMQDLQLATIPVFQFAIFYNGLMEFTWAAPFTVKGRTHANGSIYTGSSKSLSFDSVVTATSTIQKRDWAGYTLANMTGSIGYSAGNSTNVPTLTLPIGTNNTADAVREIINMPPAGEDPNSAMGRQRYFNKSGIQILVSNDTVTAVIRSNSIPISLGWTLGNLSAFLNTNVSYFDQREGKTIKATEFDVGKFKAWMETNINATIQPLALSKLSVYVADNRTVSGSELTAVRLVNGQVLPTNGMTFATPNPLYVKGHYNVTNSAHLGTTNTTSSAPASLASDALTILSSNWNDTNSSAPLGSRGAADTTLNAAVVTGVVYSTGVNGSSFSGGVMNLPRMLEDWGNGSRVLTLNTSIVCLFNSARATAQWKTPGTYYYAPSRAFTFDNNFLDPTKLPPGSPQLNTLIRGRWYNPPVGVTNYAGL